MPLYTLYPCRENGGSETFHTVDLADDEAAQQHAACVLQQHLSCDHIAVWCGDRLVARSQRAQPEAIDFVASPDIGSSLAH